MNNLIDAHCHLAEERIASNLQNEIEEANKVGISHFFSSALCQKEFEWHQDNAFPGMKWCAGIHPYYDESAENDFKTLIKLCDEKQIIAIGEIGLDKRKNNFEWQKKILLQQLDLARNYDLPVVFHNVRQYYEMHKILKKNFPKIRGIQHSFKGSQEIFEVYKNYDIAFSVCSKLPKDGVIRSIIKHGFYLFETDAPYQKPPHSKEKYNHLKNLLWTVEKISKITRVDITELKEIQYLSYQNIFHEDL